MDPVVKTDAVKVAYNKGDRVRAQWLSTKLVSLAGVQMKMGAEWKEIVGVVKHIRGDDPTNPKEIRVYIDPENEWTGTRVEPFGCICEGPAHVEVRPEWVVEVL